MLDLVGPIEIAEMFGVHQLTVYRWKRDGILPIPDATLRRGPVWMKQTIVDWGQETGRTKED
jgi:transposase